MRRASILFLISSFLYFGLFAANLFAQDEPIVSDKPVVLEQPRIIEEEIVLSDPTVAQPKKWLIGATGEYWYVSQKWNRYYANGDPYSWGSMSGSMPGGTITVGYDSFTVAYSYRKGSWTGESTISAAANSAGLETNSVLDSDQTEHEITARWLFKVSSHFNPYVMAGYSHLTKADIETIITPGVVWTGTGGPVLRSDYTFKSPLVGLGAIIPFNKYIGMRIDGRVLYTFADFTRNDGRSATGTGAGAAIVGTIYWNIWEGLNLQVGGKYQYMYGGSEIGSFGKYGAFGMLGYTFKF
jgi:hypothetical protein